MKKILLVALGIGLIAGCSGRNWPFSPRVEPSGMSTSTAPPAAAPPVVLSTAPALPPPPPTSGIPTEAPKSPPGPAPITPQTAKQATQKNVEQAKEAASKAVESAKDTAQK